MGSVSVHGTGPLYKQLKEIFIQRIADGEWQAGALIPSEMQLAAELNVSQGTVRKALNDLVAINVLVRQQGKGTFVSTHNAQRVLFHFFRITANDGVKVIPTSRVLACSRRRASKQEATVLKLNPGSRVIVIERVRELANQPTIAETIVLPTALFPDLGACGQDLPNTLYELYQDNYGVTIHRADEKLRAIAAGEKDARTLQVKVGTPLLEIERTALNLSGKPVELRISRCKTVEHYYHSTIA